MNPFFSIIVPVYNVKELLPNCINSIISQSFNNYEIIIIDDGSSDGSSDVCDDYSKKYPFIRCFHKLNGGLSSARNYGIDKSTGKYLIFIDSDDIIHKDFCKVLYDVILNYSTDIASVNFTPFYSYNEISELIKKSYTQYDCYTFEGIDILKQYLNPKDNHVIPHGLCNKAYISKLFNDFRFEEGRLHEDLIITNKLLSVSKKYIYIDLDYYYYYQNNNLSICHNYTKKNFNDEIYALKYMIDTYSANENLCGDLLVFVLKHYLYLIYKISFNDNYEIILKNEQYVKKWLYKKICSDKKFFMSHYIHCLFAFYPKLYVLYKHLKK